MAHEDEVEAVVAAAIDALAALHAADPRTAPAPGGVVPREARWTGAVAGWVDRLADAAPPALRIAAHAQHLERWLRPRSDYPAGRAGYLRWRRDAGSAAAARAEGVCRAAGGDARLAARVAQLVRKEGLGRDPEVVVLEDAACLAFLELDAASFAAAHADDEVVRILARTWRKMSPAGRAAACGLSLPEPLQELLARAVDGREAADNEDRTDP